MADVTITGLPNASTLTGSERVPMDQSGTTVDAAASAIAALATKTTVGLGNADNTSDANKPVSTATQAALDGKATAGAIGSAGLTMTAGVLGRDTGTGAPVVLTLGSGLSIVAGALTASGGGGGGSGTVTSVAMSVPTGLSVAGSPITTSGTLALTFAAGYSLPTTTSQAGWDAAAVLAGTAVQPAGLTSYVQTSDARLSDSREWSATTVAQATAEAGISTTRVAYNPLRVFQSIAAYIAANFSAVGQALATAANAGAARTTLGLGSLATQSGTFSGTSSGTNTGDQDLSGYLSSSTAATTYQPLDADLTSIAALSTASAGRSLLTLAAVPSGALVGISDTQTLTFKTLGSLTETVFTITDAAAFEINPANGPIQTITLGANRTPAATSFASGQSVKLKIDDGSAFAITWTTVGVVWIGQTAGASGTAPTLGTTGWTHIELWKEGSIIYGALIGYSAT